MINIKYSFSTLIAVSFTLFFTACEDVVDISLDEAPQLLVVDAWLNNKSEEQVIKLTLSQAYFDSQLAEGIDQASIVVSNKNDSDLVFASQGDGQYTWTPAPGETIGQIGDEFSLSIDWNGELYTATSIMNPAPKIDSVTYEFRTDELIGPDGIYAEFFARDIVGRGNTYWIKAFKNGQFLNKPAELNIAFDAGFDGGADTDGRVFIPPIRELINRVPDEDNPDDDIDVPPYAEGDSIYVEDPFHYQ